MGSNPLPFPSVAVPRERKRATERVCGLRRALLESHSSRKAYSFAKHLVLRVLELCLRLVGLAAMLGGQTPSFLGVLLRLLCGAFGRFGLCRQLAHPLLELLPALLRLPLLSPPLGEVVAARRRAARALRQFEPGKCVEPGDLDVPAEPALAQGGARRFRDGRRPQKRRHTLQRRSARGTHRRTKHRLGPARQLPEQL